ncbi:MAG: nucleotide exchange factor GrpE [Chitinophagaceae bacterium]|nr:nucleotide exchange factor GrpE [Chitinophagaceae bacterium]
MDKKHLKEEENLENKEDTPDTEEKKDGETEMLKKELQEIKDKYIRLYSEFDNFKRRTAKERIETIKTASESVLKAILPVVDDFERSFKAIEGKTIDTTLKEGTELIYNKLIKVLEQNGVKSMDTKIKEDFDPEKHEAITQISVTDSHLKGKIVDVLEKGYYIQDKVIRFSKVITGT